MTMRPSLRACTSFPNGLTDRGAGGGLFRRAEELLDSLHHGALVTIEAIPFDLCGKFLEPIDVDNGVIALCVVIAVAPVV